MNAYYIIYVYNIFLFCEIRMSVYWCFVDMQFAENAYTDAELLPFDKWICIYNE